MSKTRATVVAGFTAGRKTAWVTQSTFVGEPARGTDMYRVVGGYDVVGKPATRVVAPMTPVEARRHAAWLMLAADEADMLNERFVEAHDPRVDDPKPEGDEDEE